MRVNNCTCRLYLIVCFVLLVFLACAVMYIEFGQDKPSFIIIVNNSGQELVLMEDDDSNVLPPFEATETTLHRMEAFFIKLPNDAIWQYNLSPIDIRTYRHQHRIYMQIQPDGKIYVLPYKTLRPVKELPSQPVGYPLAPRKSKRK